MKKEHIITIALGAMRNYKNVERQQLALSAGTAELVVLV